MPQDEEEVIQTKSMASSVIQRAVLEEEEEPAGTAAPVEGEEEVALQLKGMPGRGPGIGKAAGERVRSLVPEAALRIGHGPCRYRQGIFSRPAWAMTSAGCAYIPVQMPPKRRNHCMPAPLPWVMTWSSITANIHPIPTAANTCWPMN